MGSLFKLVSEINSSKTEWAMKLRLVRSYRVPTAANRRPSLECVFHDMQGERVHATMNGDQLNRFSPLLTEGRLYAVKNFIVTSYKNRYRTTSNRKLIVFIQQTKVIEVIDENFTTLLFNFKQFNYLSDVENFNEAEPFDVIGRVITVNKPKLVGPNGAETKLMEIVLEDTRRTQVYCSLWEEYADQMEAYVRNAGQEPLILIIQFCRGKIFQERVVLSSTYNATKLGFNLECAEVEEFRKRFDDDDFTLISVSSSVSIGSSTTTAEEIPIESLKIKTIEQLTQDREVGSFWVLARIVSIETFGGWWYLSCRICKKKLKKEDDRFKCKGCKKIVASGTPRYKIQVRVQDETDNAISTLWDQQCITLIGKTVAHVLEDEQNNLDSLIPDALYRMLNAEAFFCVQVNPEQITGYTEVYSVKKLTKDKNMLKKFSSNGSQEGTSKSQIVLEFKEVASLKRKLIDEFSPIPEKNTTVMIKTEEDSQQKGTSKSQTVFKEVVGLKRKLIDEFSPVPEKKTAVMNKAEEDSQQV